MSSQDKYKIITETEAYTTRSEDVLIPIEKDTKIERNSHKLNLKTNEITEIETSRVIEDNCSAICLIDSETVFSSHIKNIQKEEQKGNIAFSFIPLNIH